MEKPLKYSEIMRQTELSSTELSRQLQRLASDSILEKNSSDSYQLTHYGRLVIPSIPMMNFFHEYKEYFRSHDFTIIPDELVDDIASLRKGNLVNSMYKSIKLQQDIVPTIRAQFWLMTDDLPSNWVDTTKILVSDGVEMRVIVPPRLANSIKEEVPPKLGAGILLRTLPEVKTVVGYSDKHALLCFPFQNGGPDRNYYLFGYDFGFKHWVYHFFNHYWRKATKFDL